MFLIPLSFVKSRKHVTGKAQPALTPDSAKQDFSNQAYKPSGQLSITENNTLGVLVTFHCSVPMVFLMITGTQILS